MFPIQTTLMINNTSVTHFCVCLFKRFGELQKRILGQRILFFIPSLMQSTFMSEIFLAILKDT